jgi:hypothetical protein
MGRRCVDLIETRLVLVVLGLRPPELGDWLLFAERLWRS